VGAPGFALADQIGKDQDTNFNGGGHPWDLTAGKDAVLLLFNHSAVAKYFNVKIGNGKVLWQQAWQLAPMETRAVNIRNLIVGQVKDLDGAVLPLALDQGEIGLVYAKPWRGLRAADADRLRDADDCGNHEVHPQLQLLVPLCHLWCVPGHRDLDHDRRRK
jgi:hypothetical protein